MEVVVKVSDNMKIDNRLFSEIEKEIASAVRLKLAKDMLLKDLDKILSESELSDEDCIRLGRIANKSSLSLWKKKGWL